MFKYNLAVFIKLLSLLVLLTPLLFSQENNNDSTLKTSQIYERIMFIEVRGSQRIESDTIKSYMTVKPGDLYDDAEVDRSLKILFNTGLFADVAIRYEKSGLIVFVIENPIINRIDFEGNKALKDDKFEEEIELSPRSVYTRSKVQADVQRYSSQAQAVLSEYSTDVQKYTAQVDRYTKEYSWYQDQYARFDTKYKEALQVLIAN